MVNNSKALNKYLEKYAEPEIACLSAGFGADDTYQHALLIPAYLEDSDFLERLDKALPNTQGPVLLVLISNHPDNLQPDQLKQAVSAHLSLEQYLGQPVWGNGHLSLFKRQNYDVLLVDRTRHKAIPASQGVGLARKIGADLIASLIQRNRIASHWIMSTDADAILPSDYFAVRPGPNTSAITYPFEHRYDQSPLGQATLCYEKSIKHYVEGLKQAGSDYAFSSLGSCLAFRVDKYAEARGFPKRAGGEDFYLLNKLAKLGRVESETHFPTIQLQARRSHRVPFGTGPAVSRLLSAADMREEPLFYHPQIFQELRLVIEALKTAPSCVEEMNISAHSQSALSKLGVEQAFAHAVSQKLSGEQYNHHIRSWFDGFRTLKFVHSLRDTELNGTKPYASLTVNQFEALKTKTTT